MEVKTKFEMGDNVFFMHQNRIQNTYINAMKIALVFESVSVNTVKTHTEYYLYGFGVTETFSEERLYESKEALIKKL